MIRKLKIKFITLTMVTLLALLTIIVTGMNLISYNSVINDADTVLLILSQNSGSFPNLADGNIRHFPGKISTETPYESRYFSVFLDEYDKVISTDIGKIASVDDEQAVEYAQMVLNKNKPQGFVDKFRYIVMQESGGHRITFLNCEKKLDFFYSFLFASLGMAIAGYIVAFFVMVIFSGKIIKPITESYEKQKQFITDAGHEIKTPLTIINANVDILESEIGKNESLSDISQQTKRLRSLTNDLVLLARMEEAEDTMQKIEFPVSDAVFETVQSFRNLAFQQGKEFVCNIQPMLTLNGNYKAIQQLVSILIDNALKYSPSEGTIVIDLIKQNHNIYFSVFNTNVTEINSEQLNHVFERFYRTDASRNSETGGHGIGLSVAKAIVNAHGGKISAASQDGKSFKITASFPA